MGRRISAGIVIILIIAWVAWVAWSVNMGQYETPRYSVEISDGAFELRHYEPMLAAEVETTGSREKAITQGFMILADYIFGNNIARDNVAMTTPVTQQASTIAMTTPVTQTRTDQDDVWRTRFMMPSKYTLQTLPQPNDERISIIMTQPILVAAKRFTWRADSAKFSKNLLELEAWLETQHLKKVGIPVYAIYNPPWTIPFLRRNEVWVEVSKD